MSTPDTTRYDGLDPIAVQTAKTKDFLVQHLGQGWRDFIRTLTPTGTPGYARIKTRSGKNVFATERAGEIIFFTKPLYKWGLADDLQRPDDAPPGRLSVAHPFLRKELSHDVLLKMLKS